MLVWYDPARPLCGPFYDMANIQQQKKRNRISERQRDENLRYRSTVKTLTKRLETAAAADDKDKFAAEHLLLVRTVDKAASRGALHKNTAARKKARAARLAAGSGAGSAA
jgi:small subunit ribosomal protein S20